MMKRLANCGSCHGCSLGGGQERFRPGRNEKNSAHHYRIALAGNPNTGKSTIFNTLTGLRQHTGNWPGKTVGQAIGYYSYRDAVYELVDLPGTYSLLSTSEDEEIARDYLLFDEPAVTIVVADATRLERNMNLILQVLEITDKVVLVVNLLDEAKRNNVQIDLAKLSELLGIPVVGASARSGEGLQQLVEAVAQLAPADTPAKERPRRRYLSPQIEERIAPLVEALKRAHPELSNPEWVAFRLIEHDQTVATHYSTDELNLLAEKIHIEIGENLHGQMLDGIYRDARTICGEVVQQSREGGTIAYDRKIDKIVTSKRYGIPLMILLLALVFWLTIVGSNYPSEWLNTLLVGELYPFLRNLFSETLSAPSWLTGILIDGVYLSTAWVVAVMLPPMAIFFPLLTLLEDFGYLPRIAFNLDELFRRVGAHGKQALTMSMGFGCNAAGVVSTRIIDSQRERMIAILTNNFSLCNGRWPTQILLATIFIGVAVPSPFSSVVAILAVLFVALLGVMLTFASSWLLSRTLLKGEVSTFSLELPPYRPPQFWRTLYSSLVERTLIVLWRAVVFAAPAGALIWLCTHVHLSSGESIAAFLVHLLDTPAYWMGLNGIILLAYILALPANELVLPTIMMLIVLLVGPIAGGVEREGVLFDVSSPTEVKELLTLGGFSLLTAVNLMLFCLLHHPCSTTIYTIYKETRSFKWTLIGTLMPLVLGIIVTIVVAMLWRFFA